METKTCTKCCELKEWPEAFRADKARAGGAKQPCKDCHNRASQGRKRKSGRGGRSRPEVRRRYNLMYGRRRRALNKRRVMDMYGGRCACCGESELAFLTIDHINNDGAAHRKETKREGQSFYASLLKSEYAPDRFQVLCFNCNCAKRVAGCCPHEAANEMTRAATPSFFRAGARGPRPSTKPIY